jgi:flagellar motor switch protein FliN
MANSDKVQTFVNAVRDSAAAVLSQTSGVTWQAEFEAGEGKPAYAVELTFTGACVGKVALGFSAPDALQMARIFAGDILDASAWTSDHAEALHECVRQVVGDALARCHPGQDTKMDSRLTTSIEFEPAGTSMIVCIATPSRLDVQMYWDAIFAGDSPVVAVHIASEMDPASARFALIEDVQLPVSLCFGRRRMLLREVLELRGGTVIELDQEVEAPVELLLDDRVIARGEVVVVDGSYGLRVLEIAGPERRA